MRLLILFTFLFSSGLGSTAIAFDGIVFQSKVTQLRYFAEKTISGADELQREIDLCSAKLAEFQKALKKKDMGILLVSACQNNGNDSEISITGAILYPEPEDQGTMIIDVKPEDI